MSPPIRGAPQPPESIAVIGMGCRFPGAAGPQAFWELMSKGGDAIREIPPERRDLARLYDQGGKGTVSRWGGFLENIDRFDAGFFGISPREADRIDPQQRLLLEVAWEALEDGGQASDRLGGSPTGVFVGLWINDYEALMFSDPNRVDFYMTTGSGRYSASGRISYCFGLQGPSLTVDTACSSSLVAVHLACQALRNGECTLALAGGANVILAPPVSVAYAQAGMLSPEGRCRFGDAKGNGYVRSEGAGVVVLKLLSRALADGDAVQAVILGSAVNNDGQTSGFLTTPGIRGQEELLRKAYREAGVEPARLQYIEAHGTGTAAGDPVELAALGSVLAQGRPSGEACLVGSVKTNIGHTEGAAGVAGLIKVVLSLKRQTIPASLHFQEPNPAVPWSTLPLVIPRETIPWPSGPGPALAGVSAFGITGTNAHVVVEEAPAVRQATSETPGPWLLPLSARSAPALKDLAAACRDQLRAPTLGIADLCYTASVRRAHHDHRLALLARNAGEAAERLDAFVRGEPQPGSSASPASPGAAPKVVFVFPGQGWQWHGMARQILAYEPVFRGSLEAADHAVQEEAGFSVLEALAAEPERSRLDEIDVIQPVLFSIQVALASLWRSWGIEPAAVVGHSMGEVAAAHVAGVLSLADAARVICRRSRLLRRVRGQGAMAVVELSCAEAQDAIAGHEQHLSVAVSNSSRSTVLSGDPGTLDAVIAGLEAQDIFCRRVKVDVASHSPQMDLLREDLLEALDSLHPMRGQLPLYSTVTLEVEEGAGMGPAYWARNLREPVMFSAAVQQLCKDGHSAFLEISAHPILLPALQQELQHLGGQGSVLASLRREEEERATLLESLGALYALGSRVDWRALHPQGGRCLSLPSYPWQRERFWYEAASGPGRRVAATGSHPLLGPHIRSSTDAGAHFWETELDAELVPWLGDHKNNGVRVVPASAYAEMALAAAGEAFRDSSLELSDLHFEHPLALPGESPVRVQVTITQERPGTATFQVSSFAPGEGGRLGTWTRHAQGAIRLDPRQSQDVLAAQPPAAGSSSFSSGEHYRGLAARGIEYGPRLQSLGEIWCGDGRAEARVAVPEDAVEGAYRIRPALLEAGFQLLMAAAGGEAGRAGGETLIPAGLKHLRVGKLSEGGEELRGYASLRPRSGGTDGVEGDFILRDQKGRPLLEARGIRLETGERESRDLDHCFFVLDWEATTRGGVTAVTSAPGRWLVLASTQTVSAHLADLLREGGEAVVTVSPGGAFRALPGGYEVDPESLQDWRRLLSETGVGGPWRGVVHLWSVDAPSPDKGGRASLRQAHRLGVASVSPLVEALAAEGGEPPPLWLVTAGTQAVSSADDVAGLGQAPLWGLGRVLAREHSGLRCTTIDLSSVPPEAELRSLRDELLHPSAEEQIALRGGQRYVARLSPQSPEAGDGAAKGAKAPAAGRPYRAVIAKAGALDSLALRVAARRAPGRGQVEIEVEAVGLSFPSVLSALGLRPASEAGSGSLGLECAGRICGTGEGTEGLHVGDEVLAVALDSLASHVVADARLLVPRPAGLNPEEAATLPVSFITARYALRHLADLQPKESVLIHAAAGGVGLAAVQMAQEIGAEVLATAGSPDKREFLKSLGVRHVMDSRSLAFVDEVREATGGAGVNVVLNSLGGEAASASLQVLSAFGRFVDLTLGDPALRLPRAPCRRGLSYFALDFERMIQERPTLVGSLLHEVVALVEKRILRPLPVRTFPVGELAEGFRSLAEARQRGKVALRVRGENPPLAAGVVPQWGLSEGTYLVTGHGDLALDVARWLAGQGAKHLALVGEGPANAPGVMEALSRQGVEIRCFRGDLADEAELGQALEAIRKGMPRLRGVVHAANLSDDASGVAGALAEPEVAARVAGAWNLHALTARDSLDRFVMFSSAASWLGSPGRAERAAADAFLDALGAHRRARGLPGVSVAWGPWSKEGREELGSISTSGIPAQGRRGEEGKSATVAGELPPLTETEEGPLDQLTYGVGWPRAERDPLRSRRLEGQGRWIILADRGGVGGALAALLRARGESCELLLAEAVGSVQRVEALLRERSPEGTPVRGVVHLWSLDAPATEGMTLAALESAHALGGASVLGVVRALAAAGGPRLWLVTRGAQGAGRPASLQVAQAPLWGLGRVLALEQPECWGGLIDLDPQVTTGTAERLLAEITEPDGEDQVAFCGEERRVARLLREPLLNEARLGPLTPGTYLVTGGLGGVGLQVARWLVERGAGHLVLTSRGGLPARSAWSDLKEEGTRRRVEAVRSLEALGTSVTVAPADAADPEAMAGLFQSFGRTLPSLRGVVHAAGILTVSDLRELELAAFLRVLRPKVTGAWVLHELTRELDLDFFVLFSSAAAVWGSKGLGHYAAANHFLDALAHYRRSCGLPALSVNWGWLSGGGITSAGTETFFRRVGLQELSAAQTLEALGRLLAGESTQKTVARVKWDLFRGIYEAWGPRPILRGIDELEGIATHLEGDDQRPAPRANSGSSSNGSGLRSLSPGQGRLALERILREQPPRVAVMALDKGHWQSPHAPGGPPPLLTRLSQDGAAGSPAGEAAPGLRLAEALLAIEPGRRRWGRLESHLRERVAQVLKLAAERVDVNKPFRALGLDSLMALELRNRLEADLGRKLPATLVFNHPTVTALVPHLAERMGVPLEEREAEQDAGTRGDESLERVLAEIEQMSAEEARRVLAEEAPQR